MFSIMLDLRHRACLVVGGGSVGRRKASKLVAAGGRPKLICLESSPADLEPGIDWRTEPYGTTHLEGMSLVFAAATSAVNEAVVSDAKARHIWVNSASDPEAGDFFVPAVARRGRIQVAVGTDGTSPALAGQIRDDLAERVDESMAAWVDLVAEVRDEILTNIPRDRSRDLLRRFARREWLERIRIDGPAAVRQAIREVVDRERGR